MAALAILEEYVEKKGTLDNLSVDVAQEKKKTSYFLITMDEEVVERKSDLTVAKVRVAVVWQ